jgi:hypothetical protein
MVKGKSLTGQAHGYVPPEGVRIVYETKRHWYEIVAEISDAVWWSAIIVLFTITFSFLYKPLAWLTILIVYPIGSLSVELIRWNTEHFLITESDRGHRFIVKSTGLFRKVRIFDPITQGMGRTEEEPWLGRQLGFMHVKLAAVNRIYLEGQRVPVRLVKELDRQKAKDDEGDSDDTLVKRKLAEWLELGLVSHPMASAAATTWVGRTL